MHFETEYCFACGMQGLDLRGPTSYIISLHGARQCNEHSLGQVLSLAAPLSACTLSCRNTCMTAASQQNLPPVFARNAVRSRRQAYSPDVPTMYILRAD